MRRQGKPLLNGSLGNLSNRIRILESTKAACISTTFVIGGAGAQGRMARLGSRLSEVRLRKILWLGTFLGGLPAIWMKRHAHRTKDQGKPCA